MLDKSYNPFSLEGKSILVTGASSGIGRAVAVACSRMGATVYATGRNVSRLEETANLLYDSDLHKTIVCDLLDTTSIQALTDQLPLLDGIVHCAGIGHRKPCKLLDENDLSYVMSSNFNSVVLLQSSLLSKKKMNKGASIVIVASRAAEYPSVGNAVYSASKAALISYAKCLGLELSPQKIRVNCICPAMIWTPLILEGGIDEDILKEAEKKYPLKRYGKPDDVSNLVMFLLSDAASWMTGSEVPLTGGARKL